MVKVNFSFIHVQDIYHTCSVKPRSSVGFSVKTEFRPRPARLARRISAGACWLCHRRAVFGFFRRVLGGGPGPAGGSPKKCWPPPPPRGLVPFLPLFFLSPRAFAHCPLVRTA